MPQEQRASNPNAVAEPPQRFPGSGLTIAIVGRPNVGKSTLFNRLVGERQAVVSPIRGTTRDRIFGRAVWRGAVLTLIDTGGVEFAKGDALREAVQRHVRMAVREAQAVVLVVDAQEGLVPADELAMAELRSADKPILVVANKADTAAVAPAEFFALGVPEVLAISALHGRGIGELLDQLAALATGSAAASDASPSSRVPALAILGRPNVGKSSLLNAMVREERSIVSEQPGTTRDAVDTLLATDAGAVRLIDTAGLRHRRKVRNPVDTFAMSRTVRAIGRCDVALLVLDATQGVVTDDRRIVTHVAEAGRGLIVLVNKWDLVKGVGEEEVARLLRRTVSAFASVPILTVSAKTGCRVAAGLRAGRQVAAAMWQAHPEAQIRAQVERLWSGRPLPRLRGRPIRLRGARWIAGHPVRVELSVSPPGQLPKPFQQSVLRGLQAAYPGVPIQVSAV